MNKLLYFWTGFIRLRPGYGGTSRILWIFFYFSLPSRRRFELWRGKDGREKIQSRLRREKET